ncbi:ribokinase [Novosphingobium sp. CF614]|uniref:ribokinase n=1 Tax=Novosphingobium sp. CF614 TaxID=1884364 RepID=UPI0008E2664C|nr:ribokinase [Novosphingobium sp. CF614]SFG03544.1 ribokinase [Novosphingobium sp. CF614]
MGTAPDIVILGSLNMDFGLVVPDFPRPGETLLCDRIAVSPGGKGGNQAVAAARAGARVAFVGVVGDDANGSALIDFMRGENIATDAIFRADAPTGMAYVVVNGAGENTIVVAAGANQRVTSDHCTQAPSAPFYLAQLEVPVRTVEAFFARGRAEGATCVLNAAPACADAHGLFDLCDIIIVNESELESYAGYSLADAEAAIAAAMALLSRPGQSIIVTQGSRGILHVSSGGGRFSESHKVDVVDTTGAGDCFCGNLVARLAQGASQEQAISRASAAAALSVSREGAAFGMPYGRDTDTFLSHAF